MGTGKRSFAVASLLAAAILLTHCGGADEFSPTAPPPPPSFNAELAGRVIDDSSGAPIPDSNIAVTQLGSTFTKSRADGTYRLPVNAGSGTLQASAFPYEHLIQPIQIRPGANPLDIRLKRTP